MPRLLVINPNTTAVVTERMATLGRALAPADLTIVAETGHFGPSYISDQVGFAIAGHAALDAFARHVGTVDSVFLACFGDPGLLALREIANVPVTGMAEASFSAASRGGRRFAIVTGGVRWPPMLRALVDELGYRNNLAGIETVTLTGGEIAANPNAAMDVLTAACEISVEAHKADVVILGGAGLVGLASRIAPRLSVPVICSVEAGFATAFDRMRGPSPQHDRPRNVTVGLSPALATLMAGG